MRAQSRKKRRGERLIQVGVIFLLAFCAKAPLGFAQEDEIAAGGRFQYQSHCAVCHGVKGVGDGRMAGDLLIKPSDLTQLAKKNGGSFPFWKVYRVIDGRDEVEAHGSRAMPVWGVWFQVMEGSELLATGRILELIYYLKSIQKK
jgi:mono/diheme cytochrome c family protein